MISVSDRIQNKFRGKSNRAKMFWEIFKVWLAFQKKKKKKILFIRRLNLSLAPIFKHSEDSDEDFRRLQNNFIDREI